VNIEHVEATAQVLDAISFILVTPEFASQSIGRFVGIQQGDEFLVGIRHHRAPPAATMTSISTLAPTGNAATAIVVRAG